MKKLLSLCILLVALCKITFADALSVIPGTEAATYNVIHTSEKTCNTRIVIRNEAGHTIFSEMIRNQCSFVRPYNFAQLPYGAYTITSINEEGKKVTTINHQPVPEKEIKFNVLKRNDNKYLLQVPATGLSKIRITIYTGAGEVYSDTVKPTGDFSCMYTINDMPFSETVRFEVTAVR